MRKLAIGCEGTALSMRRSMWAGSGGLLRGAWAVALCVVTACGDDGDAGGSPGPDASSPDGAEPDAGVPDAMPPNPDGGVDAMPPDAGPWPLDPHAGQFEWAVILPGIADQVVLASGQDGSIFVAGDHRSAVDVGEVHLPAPVGSAIAVLKLDARARPIWARSLGGASGASWRTNVRSITVTAEGDVAVGGAFLGGGFDAGTGPLPAAGETEGFVVRLDGTTGVTQWARSFAGRGDDDVSTVAADPSSDALYVHGEMAGQQVDGVWQPSFAFLERYDASGLRVWSRRLAMGVSWQHELAIDRDRGPVVTGRYHGSLEVDGLRLEVERGDEDGNLAVIGFTPDGQARFARQIFDENQGYYQRLLAAPDGRLYVSTTTEGKEVVLDDEHGLRGPDYSSDAVLVRLTPDGLHEWATLIDAQVAAYPQTLAADADGAVYMVAACDRGIALSPAITCNNGGSFLVSYGPNGDYRWSTYVYGSPGWAQAIAAVPGKNRLLVAGQVGAGASFGGVQVPGAGLFVASVVTGRTYADPLPPPPVVTSVVLEGVADGHIRQGGSGTVVVSGEHLEQIKSVRVGSRDLFIDDATPGTLRIPYVVPHGEALGPLRLVITHPRGQLSVTSGVEVSPIVVAPSGTDTGRGTLTSPWRLCRDDWQSMALRGDTIRLLAGVHPCDRTLYVQRGVIIEGAGTARTKVGAVGRRFGAFNLWEGPHGKTRFSQLTFQGGNYGAISQFGNVVDDALRDVDFVGLTTPGLWMDYASGRVSLERVRYLEGHSVAIYSAGELQVDGRDLTIKTTSDGIKMVRGALALRDSTVAASRTAIQMGDLNDSEVAPRHLLLEGSKVSGYYGVEGYGADLDISDSELAGVGEPQGGKGIYFVGGTLRGTRMRIHGFTGGIAHGLWGLDADNSTANMDLDDVDVMAAGTGVQFSVYGSSWLRVRRSRIAAGSKALHIWGPFLSADLGTAAAPGDNALTATPSGQALVDNRTTVDNGIDATGTTLNGHSYSGELYGPRNDADLVMGAANVIRF